MDGPLSWPFLRLYILALFFFSANAILNVIIPLKGHSEGASNTIIGIIMGAYMITAMLFRPWAGQMIARFGAIKILRLILVINGAALVLYGFIGLEGYVFARIIQGGCTAFFSMSLQIGILDRLPEKDRAQGISLYSLFSYIPGILGPLLAISIWQFRDFDYFTITMIVIAVITGLFGYSATHNTKDRIDSNIESSLHGPIQVFAQLFKNPYLFQSGSIMLLSSIIFGAVATFIVLYVQYYEIGNAGIFLAIQAIAVVLSRYYLRKLIPSDGLWHRKFILIALAMLMSSSMMLAVGWKVGAWLIYIAAVLIGVTQALIYPALTTYLSFKFALNEKNVLLGLFISTADLGVSLGAGFMGIVSDWLGYSGMYAMCVFIAGAAMLLSLKNIEKMEYQ
ncbi:MFS transporter [Staphylococcus condimenti]|uniref:MFS transporter n=1 Tax=Staphylococcus condimenti TaxID=70255 RepID=A0A4Q7CNV7_9STAP|nr:MFS transporter [Staphylococcus condimenti]RZI01665.1 MFS transporter [Staphylococcus condimenti]RZI03473.1 MFS transporter [Staphylococcus condimenti]